MANQAPAPVDPASGGLLNFIERASRDPEFDVAKFEALLRMQQELVREQARRDFNAAMAAAQTEMMPIVRDAVNEHTKSRYAKLETIDRIMRPIYTQRGFAVRFGSEPSPHPGWFRITCTVSHAGGYSETNHLDAPPDLVGSKGTSNKTAIQGVGSSVTYLRRYLLSMVFNIVLADPEDDDGEGSRYDQRERRTTSRPADDAAPGLDEPNGTLWLKNLDALLHQARTLDAIVELETDPRVKRVRDPKAKTPSTVRALIDQYFSEAVARVKPKDEPSDQTWPDDPIGELLAEIEDMDLDALDAIAGGNAAWRAKVREATADFPPDEDRINEAVALRRASLQSQGTKRQ